ncbi:MAG: hypothetical protein IPK95_12245 [Cellvibrionales bacterium]|nr:hypothetical protein [Cellvibrionales bacterium]
MIDTNENAFAVRLTATIPARQMTGIKSILLCGNTSYRIHLHANNVTVDREESQLNALIDKRQLNEGAYRIYIETPDAPIEIEPLLTISKPTIQNQADADCKTMRESFHFKKAFDPLIAHYCKKSGNVQEY